MTNFVANNPGQDIDEIVATAYPDTSYYWTTKKGVYVKPNENAKVPKWDVFNLITWQFLSFLVTIFMLF